MSAEGKRYLWYSDTHLNNASRSSFRDFVRRANDVRPDGMFLTGDVSTGSRLAEDLETLAMGVQFPVYFVLGNHDYHLRSVSSVHEDVRALCRRYENLVWMTDAGVVSLSEDVALVGVEGWYDAVYGDPRLLRFTVDWFLTKDFLGLGWEGRLERWRRMAEDSADVVGRRLVQAFENHQEAYVLTHFPPWREADRAHGTMFESFWTPYNTNVALGRRIEEVARENKKKRVTVLAGHTHSECTVRVRKNVECRVAPAKYRGVPRRDDVFVI